MGILTLYPGRIVARWYTDEETVWPESILDLSRYFFYRLEIDSEFTLRDVFRLIDGDGVEFLEAVIGERISPLLEEARTPPGSEDVARIAFLRVYNAHEDAVLRREFDGWGAWDEPYDGAWERHPDSPRAGPISVSLTPVNQLLDVPLRYDPELVFRNQQGAEEYRARIDINLIEFLKAIFYDLTFYGSPNERDEMREELRRRVDEIDRGEAELIPADQVFERLRERRRRPEDR
jgi:hypothetical protein